MIVRLSPALAAHLAVALKRHERNLRRDGVEPPATLVALARQLLSGQERPEFACWCEGRDDALVGVGAAASRLGVSPRSLRRLASTGAIPQVRIGRRVKYNRDDLDAFIEAARTTRRTG